MNAENTPVADGPAPFTFNDDGTFNLPNGEKVGSQQELGEGWMRHADYTRKTQDLAIQRKEVETAESLMRQLEVNPAGTLKALASNLGVDLMPPAPVPQSPVRQSDGWEEDGWGTPATQAEAPSQEDPRIAQLLDTVQKLQAEVGNVAGTQARSTVETELAAVQAHYQQDGIEVDPGMLVRYAQDKGFADLDVAAKVLYHDDLVAVEARQFAADQGIVEEKRAAAQAVSPSVGLAGDSPAPAAGTTPAKTTIRGAIEAAMAKHGVTDASQISFSETSSSY